MNNNRKLNDRSMAWKLAYCVIFIFIYTLLGMADSMSHGTPPKINLLHLVVLTVALFLTINLFNIFRDYCRGEQKQGLCRRSFYRRRWHISGITLTVLLLAGLRAVSLWHEGLGLNNWDSYLLLSALVIPFAVATLMSWLLKRDDEEIEAIETDDYTRLHDERDNLSRLKAGDAAFTFIGIFVLIAGSLFDVLVTHRYPVRSLLEFELMIGAWIYFYHKYRSKM